MSAASATAEKTKPRTLLDVLGHHEPAIPSRFRPYLGDVAGNAAAALPDNLEMSVSRVFRPMTSCGYKLYCSARLRLEEADELAEELSAAELGTAVHDALEQVGADPRWRVPEANRKTAAAGLQVELARHVKASLSVDAHQTPGLKAAESAQVARWQKHLAAYVDQRIETMPAGWESAAVGAAKVCSAAGFAELRGMFVELLDTRGGWRPGDKKAQSILAATVRSAVAGLDPLDFAFLQEVTKQKSKGPKAVQAAFGDADFQAAHTRVAQAATALVQAEVAFRGPVLGGLPEWSFGFKPPKGSDDARCKIKLGELDASVRGKVDLVRVTGEGDNTALHVVDYKTWSGKATATSMLQDGIDEGTAIQLPLYAIVALQKRADHPELRALMATDPSAVYMAWDRVRHASPKNGLHPVRDDNRERLGRIEMLLEALLKRARAGQFTLVPHPSKCPVLATRGVFCNMADVCRFRQLPGIEPLLIDPDAEDGKSFGGAR